MHVLLHLLPSILQETTTNPCLHWRLLGKSGSVSCGVTSPFSWVLVHTRFCLCPSSIYSQSYVSSGSYMVWLMATSSKRVVPYPRLLHPEPLSLWQSTGDLYLHRRHWKTILSQSLWDPCVLVHTRFVWALWALLVGMGFDSKCKFAPPTILLGLALWPVYRLLKMQVRWSGIPISLRIFQFVVIHTIRGFSIVNEAEIDVFLKFSCFFCVPMNDGNLISGSSEFSKSTWTSGNSTLFWDFLAVQWLRLRAYSAEGKVLIPGEGTKIPHAKQCRIKQRKARLLWGKQSSTNSAQKTGY